MVGAIGKNTPLARGVRTFLAALAANAVAWQGIDFATDWRPGATTVTIGLIGALLAGVASMLLALAGWTATTALGKALATFGQVLGTALAAIAVNELTSIALLNAGKAIWQGVVAAVGAAVLSLIVNKAEDSPSDNALGKAA